MDNFFRAVCLFLSLLFLMSCQQSADMARKKQQDILDSFKKIDSNLLKTSLSFQQDSVVFQITELSVETSQITVSSIVEITKSCKQIESFIQIAKNYLLGKKEEDKKICTQYFIKQKKWRSII